MAENKKSVLLYCDIIHTVKELSDEEAGKLFKHYLEYINDLNPSAPDKLTQIVFEPIKQNLKRDLKKWESKSERNSQIAKEGWIKRKDANACESIKVDAKHADKDKVTVTDKVTDISIRENLTEQLLSDLENSTHLEVVCKRTKLTLEQVKGSIPGFKQVANIEYAKPMDLVMHFIRWLNQNPPKDINSKPKMSW